MRPLHLLVLCPLLQATAWGQLPLVPGTSAEPLEIDGAWEKAGDTDVQLLLRERADGRLLAYVAGNPSGYLAQGLLDGTSVTLTFAGEDGDGPYDAGLFAGTFLGNRITGTFDDGDGAVPVTLRRSESELLEEHWLFIDADTDAAVRAGPSAT